MKAWDVYYRGDEGSAGRFAGTIIHVGPSGLCVGDAMVPPDVLRVTVYCEETQLSQFWQPHYVERDSLSSQEPLIVIHLRSRYLIDLSRVVHGASYTLAQLKTIDRLPAVRALRTLGGWILG